MVSNRALIHILLTIIGLLVVILFAQHYRFTAIIQRSKAHKIRDTYTITPPHDTPVAVKREQDPQIKPLTKSGNIAKKVGKGENLYGHHIYPKSLGDFSMYGDESCPPNKERNVLAKLFEKWIEIAKRAKIEFFLTCGSLLGSYRNGDLIPLDTDIDVLINREDFAKIKRYHTKKRFIGTEREFFVYINRNFYLPFEKRRRFSCRGKQVPAYMDHCSFKEPLGRLITENRHIDIYEYTKNGTQLWDPSEGGRTFKESEVFPLRRCFFMDYETKCPNKPREYLMKFYGKNLKPLKLCKNGEWVKRT